MMNVLAINSGSVSLKVKILEFDESPKTANPLHHEQLL
jgi:acetate kinase